MAIKINANLMLVSSIPLSAIELAVKINNEVVISTGNLKIVL